MIAQAAFDLFETSAHPDRDPNNVALGPNARRNLKDAKGPGSAAQDVLLGELVWYSVSDAVRLTPRMLEEAITAASLDAKRFVPRLPTPPSALSRAAEAAEIKGRRLTEDRAGEPVEEGLYANVLLRTASRGVKQLVTEVLDAANSRLSYRPVARVSPGYDAKGKPDGTVLVERDTEEGDVPAEELLKAEVDAIADLRTYYGFERSRHDGEAARRVLTRVLDDANAVPLRNSGGMYFVPRGHEDEAGRILLFVEAVRVRAENAPTRVARDSMAMKVPLADREEYRNVLADSVEHFVRKEAEGLIKEMSALIKGNKNVSTRRGRGFVERVRKLKENVAEYEELLQTRATDARAQLDVATREARALVERIEP